MRQRDFAVQQSVLPAAVDRLHTQCKTV